MLRSLSIRDFVIVQALDLEFSAGFTVFTGETGAGKSILIDALVLVLGGRGDGSVIREGATRADISAEFDVTDHVAPWLDANAFTAENGSLLLRRVIDASGRSKAFINGGPATATQLRELGELLVDIHGQHAHQSLLRTDAQRMMLDTHAGLLPTVHKVSEAYKRWQALVRQRQEFETNARNILLERERLEWQVGELEKLAPREGEWEEVSQEHNRLSHAASLMEGAQQALDALSESDSPILSQLNTISQKLAKLTDVDVALKPVMEALEPACIQVQEAVYALNDYLGKMELDPERLHVVSARMDALFSTARKFHVQPEGLPAELQVLSGQLQQLADVSDLDGLKAQEEKVYATYLQEAQVLSRGRKEAAFTLGQAVTAAMQDLSMEGGRFEIQLKEATPAAYGLEQVEFLVAGHAGVAPRPLAKVASGGELARISLAISVIASTSGTTPTLIFDEVDSGIGGGVAEVVGRLLKKLGQGRQVLCVTHLPQVASQANQHLQVSKSSEGGRTLSHITALSSSERVEEIARMLGGLEITATTRKHARELLAL